MHPFAGRGDFGEVPGEEKGPVEAGIECPKVVQVTVFNLYPSEGLVPGIPRRCTGLVESGGQFLEVLHGLLLGYERRRHPEADLLSGPGRETYYRLGVGGIDKVPVTGLSVGNDPDICKWGVRFDYEPVAEAFGYSSVVV